MTEPQLKQEIINLFEAFNRSALARAGGQETGCDYRADYIGRKAAKATGLKAGKIWAYGEEDEYTDFNTVFFAPSYNEQTELHEHQYNFHVAATLELPDGARLVLDPNLYDGPVTEEQWAGDMRFRKDTIPRIKHTSLAPLKFNKNVRGPENVPDGLSLVEEFSRAASVRMNLTLLRMADSSADEMELIHSKWLDEVRSEVQASASRRAPAF